MELYPHQVEAISRIQNGNILCGGVGSGKSRAALAYYYIQVCKGEIEINGKGKYHAMRSPRPLYIITTAKKRDSKEWELECGLFLITDVIVDSWNNIEKYKNVKDAFFIFDEQRVVGYGKWSKTFIYITKFNQWILLTATPGDTWMDYIPVFIANGFYKNKTDFIRQHVIFNQFTKYQKVERYVATQRLFRLRNKITINMVFEKRTHRNVIYLTCNYDKELYSLVDKKRWNPFTNEPIQDKAQVCVLLRRIVNTDESRLKQLYSVYTLKKRLIVFYNFNAERDLLIDFCEQNKIPYSEWNGHKHQEIKEGDQWLYLVQYSSGAEGWNCVKTDSIVFFSQSYSYKMTEQASGRIDRINTPYKELYYYFLVSNSTIDFFIRKALQNKKDFSELDYPGL